MSKRLARSVKTTYDQDHMIVLPIPFDRLPAAAQRIMTLAQDAALFRQDDTSTGIFWVRSGSVRLVRHTVSGIAVPLHTARTGGTIAEASLFSDSYHCDCVALEKTEAVWLSRAAILDRMAQDSDFGQALMARLAGQVQQHRRQIEILSIRSAQDRIEAALADGWLDGSITRFAEMIGLTREATYRALSVLVRSGRARKTGRGRYTSVGESSSAPRSF
ncbi:MAG: Crp/Fnr family transcriptional regulator [Pseudomonadota bacterium]